MPPIASPHTQERAASGAAGRPPSLLRALAAAYGRPYLWLGGLKLANDSLNFVGPILLNALLRHLGSDGGSDGGARGGLEDSTSSSSGSGGGSSGGSGSEGGGYGVPWGESSPAFGYACVALLAGSLALKVRRRGQSNRPQLLAFSCWSCHPGGQH